MKEWGLDVDKCIAFGYDGATTLIDKSMGMTAQFKAM